MKSYKQIDCFNRQLNIFKYLGIYPLQLSPWPFYEFFSKTFIFLFIILYIILGTINFFFLRRLEDFVDELTFYFTEVATMSKVLTFALQRDKMKEILDTLESGLFQPKFPKGLKIIDKTKNFNLFYWKIVAIVSVIAYMAHIISPMMSHFIFNVELVFPTSTYSFLPYNVIEAYRYPLYVYQAVGIHVMMLYNINIDTFFLGLIVLLIAQLNVLRDTMSDITNKFKKEAGHKTFLLNNDMAEILKLNRALIHYAEITKFCKLIEKVFTVTLFIQFSVASCIICICLFKFSLPAVPAPWQYYIFLSTYMFVMVVQIMVPSWFGTQVIEESNILSTTIYNCNWTPRSKQFKSSMRLFVERAKRPLSITGWKMFPLSLVTFTAIMKSAYSFFTLLRNVQSR